MKLGEKAFIFRTMNLIIGVMVIMFRVLLEQKYWDVSASLIKFIGLIDPVKGILPSK